MDIRDVDGESIKALVQFIYTGRIRIDSDNVLQILNAAHRLELGEVKTFCFDFLKTCITSENYITILNIAKEHRYFDVRDEVYKFMSENYNAIMQTKAFLSLPNNEFFLVVYHLRTNPNFQLNDETLCQSSLNWVRLDEDKRKSYFHRILKFAVVKTLSIEFIKELCGERLIQESSEFFSQLKARLKSLGMDKTKILSVGGIRTPKSVKIVFDINKKTNVVYPNLPISLIFHRLLMFDQFLYCIGGETDSQELSDKVFRINLNERRNLKWSQVESMNEKRSGPGAVVFQNSLVVCGGWRNQTKTNSAEAYDVESDSWRLISPLQQERCGSQSVICKQSMYTVGGLGNKGRLAAVERLDGLEKPWKSVASMQEARNLLAVVELDDFIYAIGGLNNSDKVLKSVEKYDCGKDEWAYVSEMNIARMNHHACILQGKIYVVGGVNDKKESIKDIEYYDASTNTWRIIAKTDIYLKGHFLVAI